MIFERIKTIISEALKVDPEMITLESSFQDDLGADSLEVFQIVMALEDEFDVELEKSMEDVKVTTVGELAEAVNKVMKL